MIPVCPFVAARVRRFTLGWRWHPVNATRVQLTPMVFMRPLSYLGGDGPLLNTWGFQVLHGRAKMYA